MATLQELLSQKAALIRELARIEEAINAFGNASSPVKISTGKNIRNTSGLTTDPEEAKEFGMVLIFADIAMTTPANRADHEGYISLADLQKYKSDHADYWRDLIQVKE